MSTCVDVHTYIDDEKYSGMITMNDYIHMYRRAIQISELDFMGNEASNVSLEAVFFLVFFFFSSYSSCFLLSMNNG